MWSSSGRRRHSVRRHGAHRDASEGVLTLDSVRRGGRVRVLRVRAGRRLVNRLAALGLVPGSLITVIRSRGPAILSVGGARVAVGRQAATAVEVEEADA
jgi:Fe2+ transport system protein FeoA